MRTSVLACLLGPALLAQSPPRVPELGEIDFARDLDVVLGTRPDKPILLLFQEVPG